MPEHWVVNAGFGREQIWWIERVQFINNVRSLCEFIKISHWAISMRFLFYILSKVPVTQTINRLWNRITLIHKIRNRFAVFGCLFWFHAKTNEITHLNAIARFSFDWMQQLYCVACTQIHTYTHTHTIDSWFTRFTRFYLFLCIIEWITTILRGYSAHNKHGTFKHANKMCDSTKRSRKNQLFRSSLTVCLCIVSYSNKLLF